MASIIKRKYSALLPDGTREERECDHWTIQYRDAAGKIKRVKGYRDKSATKQLAAKIELAQARGEQFMVDPHKAHKARALSDHATDYVSDLKTAGRDPKYVGNAEYRLAILIEGCPWATAAAVTPDSFRRWRENRQKEGTKGGRVKDSNGASARTLNHYLETARAFCNWLVSAGRMAANPLLSVAKVEGAKVRNRRALTDEEVGNLLAVAPEDRRLVYRIALAVGLRRDELEALQWGDLRLRAIKPYIQLRAEATKARRADRLPLNATLADALRSHRPADAKDSDPVLPEGVPDMDTWRADLEAAGIEYRDAMGRQADFHGGTRKTLCTRMNRSGIPLAVAMKIMRHTDARLTLVDYTDDDQMGLDEAMAGMAEVQPTPPANPAETSAG